MMLKTIIFVIYNFFLYFQFMFKATQTFVDGHQFHQRGPGADQVLEWTSDLIENVSNLGHQSQGNCPCNNWREQQDYSKNSIGLKI